MARDKTDKTSSKAHSLPGKTLVKQSKRTDEKPTPDMEAIRAINEALRADPDAAFVFKLYWRAMTLVDDPDFPNAAVAFEMMQSAFSAFEGGLAHKDIADGYPVAAWREDTVEIPRAWLRVLVEGWEKYKEASTGSTVGEALGIEGGGQGKLPIREKLSQLTKDIRLSNKALVEYRARQLEDGHASWNKAYGIVANSESVSEETVKRACRKHLKAKLNREAFLGLLAD
jgi:hypothetical protein